MYVILDMHAAPGGQGRNSEISDYNPAYPSLWESERNKIIFQGSDIEDTIDNLTFYLHGTSGCTKATCYIDGSNGSTGFSNRNKRQLVINPYNNLSYAVYTDRRQFKVHDGGKYGIYNNSGNLAQSSDCLLYTSPSPRDS